MSNLLHDAIKTALPDNTLVIFQAEDGQIKNLSKCLLSMKDLFKQHGITAVAVPKSIHVMAIPAGTRPEAVRVAQNPGMN